MEKQELNKKLAEWVGFTLEATGVNKEIPVWIEPNGVIPKSPAEYYFSGKNYGCPDFTDSLDACFKWLVPKLLSWGMDNEHQDNPNMGIVFYCTTDKTFKVWEQAYGETPALALCKAIEKLIDEEVKR